MKVGNLATVWNPSLGARYVWCLQNKIKRYYNYQAYSRTTCLE
ncbi:MAG: hypothetical protein ABI472_06980 [Ginsengibacter sp.]